MNDTVKEILSYIVNDFRNESQLAGVFAFPRKDAVMIHRAEFFMNLYTILDQETKISEHDKDSPFFFSFVEKPEDITEDTVFSYKECIESLRTVAKIYSDREYKILSSFFKVCTFIKKPHRFAGAPVLWTSFNERGEAKAENDEGSAQRSSLPPRTLPLSPRSLPLSDNHAPHGISDNQSTSLYPLDFQAPEFQFYTHGDKLTEEQQAAITKFERENGYDFDTRILRRAMGIEYFAPYQLEMLFNLRHFNYIAASRRSGKSLMATYFAVRQLFVPNQTILYVMPNEGYFTQPLVYIDRLLSQIKRMDPNIKLSHSDGVIRNRTTNSLIKMVSARMAHGIRSFDGDMIVIDEAAFCPEEEYLNLSTIIEQKIGTTPYGIMICITTIDRKVPLNWFYRELISAEIEIDTGSLSSPSSLQRSDGHASHDASYDSSQNKSHFSKNGQIHFVKRISIFENPFFSEEARNRLIAKYKGDDHALRCELLATFPSANKTIPPTFYPLDFVSCPHITSSSLPYTLPPSQNGAYISRVVLGYDPAQRQSKAALCAIAIYSSSDSESSFSSENIKYPAVIFSALHLPEGTSLKTQVEKYITPFAKHLEKNIGKAILAYDENGLGATLHEFIDTASVPSIPVHYSSGSIEQKLRMTHMKNGILYADKRTVLNNFLIPAESGRLFSHSLTLVEEMFREMDEKSENKTWMGNDMLNAIAIACTYIQHSSPNVFNKDRQPTDEEREEARKQRIFSQVPHFIKTGGRNGNNTGERHETRMKLFGY